MAAVSLGSIGCAENAGSAPPSPSRPSSSTLAWQGPPGGGWGPRGGYGRLYDTSTVETVRGQVVRVDRVAPMGGMSSGVHVIMSTEAGGTIAVHLGPAWFVENQELGFQPGDTLEATGSRVTFAGAPALIARKVAKGDDELVLRDDAGFPVWSAGRRRFAR